ncbi:MAG: hypothetical protein J6K55_00140 [Clostridia bacterium]|nr:hypothetical protein [Clostridia bacterium]
MKLKKVFSEMSSAYGMGTTQGETVIEKFLCPCGKGHVVTEQDTHTGFKNFCAWFECEECAQHYEIKNNNSRQWTIVEK